MDPGFLEKRNRIRTQVLMTKYTIEEIKFKLLKIKKIGISVSYAFHSGLPGSKRHLQPSKENLQFFKEPLLCET
jgi:hypothetical protein